MVWGQLADIMILLGAALVLGILAEQLRQSAIIGYLLAGMLIGPNVLGLIPTGEEVDLLAELGAALLLFTIGLEFSLRRLLRLGWVPFVAGGAQILLTGAAGYLVALALGLGSRPALAVGAVAALSSTAFVVRVLTDRAQTDSVFGRNAIAILLIQDIAVVPLVFFVSALSGDGGLDETLLDLGRAALLGAVGLGVLYLLVGVLLPMVFRLGGLTRNRELPILLAVLVALGATWGAHSIEFSPAVGAFAAGLLLAESPFAVQIRSDIAALRTLLITLFFSSVGMFGDPAWALSNAGMVLALVALVVVGKSGIVAGLFRLLGYRLGTALATGLTIAQVGEFSFVLAQVARGGGLFDDDLFRLILSVTVLTLLLTPYLASAAARVLPEAAAARRGQGGGRQAELACGDGPGQVVVIGYGPAGQRAADAMREAGVERLTAVDLNPRNAVAAREHGIRLHLGDATHAEVLEHLEIGCAAAVLITTPDPSATKRVIDLVRFLAPQAHILVRARYHIYQEDFRRAGATTIVDEEAQVGLQLASEARELLGLDGAKGDGFAG
ncbi:MAG TPA: cation:proton antiporter [Thermoleophilia bacterium]|nr:cation:proton antiporter [Thermoleophilia bacterium]